MGHERASSTHAPCLMPHAVSKSYIENNLLNVNEILEVEQPPQNHLDRQRHHEQEEKRPDVVARGAHLQIETAERTHRQNHRQSEIQQHEDDTGRLADEP